MKVICELKGTFERLTADNSMPQQTSLSTLVNDLRAIATSQGHHHIHPIHQSFGLDFLPQTTLKHLLKQVEGRSPFLTSTLLKPVYDNFNSSQTVYNYRFFTPNLSLNLSPDNPQIPNWSGERCESIYNLVISENTIDPILKTIRQEALTLFNQKTSLEIIKSALRSPTNFAIPVVLSNGNHVMIWLQFEDLDPEIQEAILILTHEQESNLISPTAQQLVNEYKHTYSISSHQNLPELTISPNESTYQEFVIGRKKHRQVLENMINSAEQFLAIASFRLEDELIIPLISQKAKELPQGVWILTDLGSDVLDRIDTNMEGKIEHDYAESDRRKKECLRLLAASGASIRSGLFHVKFYITEKSAYLGSCNLTGGSLERNGEAGIVWHNTTEHHQLFQQFCYLWNKQTTEEIIPSPQGIVSKGLPNHFSLSRCQGFLNSSNYKKDLTNALQEFASNPQGKISIYTRNFHPTPEQEEMLQYLPYTIFYGYRNNSDLQARPIENLHAKIVLLGTQVAYIGSQDFAFGRKSNHDLTYKITDKNTIEKIIQLSYNLNHH
jgi:hypothetical protein